MVRMQWGQRLMLRGRGAGACACRRVSALPCPTDAAGGGRDTFPSELLKKRLVKETFFAIEPGR